MIASAERPFLPRCEGWSLILRIAQAFRLTMFSGRSSRNMTTAPTRSTIQKDDEGTTPIVGTCGSCFGLFTSCLS